MIKPKSIKKVTSSTSLKILEQKKKPQGRAQPNDGRRPARRSPDYHDHACDRLHPCHHDQHFDHPRHQHDQHHVHPRHHYQHFDHPRRHHIDHRQCRSDGFTRH